MGRDSARLVAKSDASCSLDNTDIASTLWQFLSLRAKVQVRLQCYALALQDAEELIKLQPTFAEGYYWHSMALQGQGKGHEALEALMAALEYEPQNPLFQHAFNTLFEEISATIPSLTPSPGNITQASDSTDALMPTPQSSTRQGGVLQQRRPRGRPIGDALSTTTQATRLSSRSTTPTEVSAPLSQSSSNESLSVVGAVFSSEMQAARPR